MTTAHQIASQDALARQKIPLVVIGSVDQYKPLKRCELLIRDRFELLTIISVWVDGYQYHLLADICKRLVNEPNHDITMSIHTF